MISVCSISLGFFTFQVGDPRRGSPLLIELDVEVWVYFIHRVQHQVQTCDLINTSFPGLNETLLCRHRFGFWVFFFFAIMLFYNI